MRLSDLTTSLAAAERFGGDPEVRAIAYDSRKVRPGSLFVAISGNMVDGHQFLRQAVGLGAVAAVVEKYQPDLPIAQVRVDNTRQALAILANEFYDHPSRKLKLVAVTGTNGKTTTAFLLESIFRRAGYSTGLIGSIEYRINGERYRAERTTPESLDLQEILATMSAEGVDVVLMEVSSHALDLNRVDGCRFAARIFTNLSQDHLDYHENLETYFAAKGRLFADASFGAAPSLINADDEFGRRLMGGANCFSFGVEGNDYRIADVRYETKRILYTLKTPKGEIGIVSSLIGDFNVSNSAGAAAAAMELGVDPADVAAGILSTSRVPGRFEAVRCDQDFQVLIDYAHTPDGLEKVLIAARRLAGDNRVITVFGCGGDRDRGKRPKMGGIAAALSDLAIVTSDNPRSEDPQAIIDDILVGIDKDDRPKTKVIVERETAIKTAIGRAGPGDIVLIAGKGHENYQLIKDRVLPFDDRLVAEKALREL